MKTHSQDGVEYTVKIEREDGFTYVVVSAVDKTTDNDIWVEQESLEELKERDSYVRI